MGSKDRPQIWDLGSIHVPENILVPLVDHEEAPTISITQLRDPLLGIVATLEDPRHTGDKMIRQSLHQRGRDGHLRVNRFNDRTPRRTLEDRERIIQTGIFKESRALFVFEEAKRQTLEPSVTESEDKPDGGRNEIPNESLRKFQVSKGLWTSTDEAPPNPVRFYPSPIDPLASYYSILSDVASPETVDVFIDDQLRSRGNEVEPSQYDNMIPSDVRKKTYPIEDSFGHNSHP